MVAAVVFDMDGLMLDTESINRMAWQGAAVELGHTLDDAFYLTLLGRTTVDCEARVQHQCGAAFPMGEFRARRRVLWRARVDQGITIKPGLVELLAFLEARDVPMAVATSSHTMAAESSLGSANLRSRFEVVVTGDQVVQGKPAPDIYLEAARRLGVSSRECVALEDSDNGVLASSAAGMTTIMVPDLKPASEESISRALRVVPTLHEARELIGLMLSERPA